MEKADPTKVLIKHTRQSQLNLLHCNHWGNSVVLGAVEQNKRLKAGSETKDEKTDTEILEVWLTLGWLKVNDMDTDLSHLPF